MAGPNLEMEVGIIKLMDQVDRRYKRRRSTLEMSRVFNRKRQASVEERRKGRYRCELHFFSCHG